MMHLNIHLGIPQIILTAMYILPLASHAIHHGESKKVEYNFWAALIVTAFIISMLALGGFYK